MLAITFRRLILAIPLLILVSLVTFSLQLMTPVDPARMALTAGGTGITIDEADVEAKRVELGLDKPVWRQYLVWCSDVARFDLGRSFMTNRPVSQLFHERIGASLWLAATAWLASLMVAIPLGLVMARNKGSVLDRVVLAGLSLCASTPGFWIALLGMWLFAARLQWVPAIGEVSVRGILLPSAVLVLQPMSRLSRLVRATTLDLLRNEYVTVARSKGLRESAITIRHVLPNSISPVLAVIGLDLAALFSGAAVIEWIFAWPGIGRLSVDAAAAGDLPVLMAFVLVVGCAVVVANLAADLASAWIDPRLREEI